MSILTRTVFVPQSQKFMVCNQCGTEAPENDVPRSWTVFATGPYRFEDFHFCSIAHFAQWAQEWSEKQRQLAE